MANFGAKILNNAVSALNAQQAVIATTGNNIANVNTDGYVRRTIDLQNRISAAGGGVQIGSGVEVGALKRYSDAFLESLVHGATSDKNRAEIEDGYLDRVERLFSLSGDVNTIGKTMTEFFTSLDNLALNPASIELRSDVLARAQDVVDSIQQTYGGLADLQAEADSRLSVEVTTINGLTSEIANLNSLINGREAGGTVAADERDQRDKLINQLSEKLGVNVLENGDGTVNITLPNGFPLVYGVNSRNLEVTNNPDFAAAPPESLNGGVLSYIVYDFDAGPGTAHLDLTQEIQGTGGIVGGLLNIRGYADPTNTSPFEATGPLVEMAARVEALTQNLLVEFNARYLGPDGDTSNAVYDVSAVDLNGNPANTVGNTPGLYAFFTVPGIVGADPSGLPNDSDLTTLGLANFSSRLSLNITDPAQIAAGRDLDLATAAVTFAQGDASNISGFGTDPGISDLQFAAQTFDINGGVGPSFTSMNYTDLYTDSVARIGNLKSRSKIDASVSEDNLIFAQNRRDELSAVSLDEEFTSLIRFQKAFEANARMIRTADELLTQIVQLI